MKPQIFITFLSLIVCLSSHAQDTKKAPLNTYSGLWTNSPFTSKPEIPINNPVSNPFEDYHLTGIAPIKDGYRIILSNKKNKTGEKIVIEPGSNSGYEVISVDRNPDVHLGTTVKLKKGTVEGVVKFEPSLIVLNTPAAAAKPVNQLPPGFDPNQPNKAQANPQRPTRSRIVPTVNPAQNPSNKKPQAPQPRQRRGR